VAAAPLLLGGAPVWAAELIALATVALLAVLSTWELPAERNWGLYTVGGLWLFTIFQRLPLPRGLIGLVAPGRMAPVEDTVALLDGEVGWLPLTLDPGGTEVAILTGATVVAGWMLGSGLCRRYGRRPVLVLAGAAVIVTLVVSAIHWVAGAELLYGFYEPRYQPLRPVAPLANANQFGALLAFGAVLQTGLALEERFRLRRFGWATAAIASAVAAVGTGSRGAAGSLVLGFLLFGGLLALRRREIRLQRGVVLGLVGSAAAATMLVIAGSDSALESELGQQDLSKLDVAWSALPIALGHPLVGVGRGAFSASFARFDNAGLFTHPENLLVQWVVEWGLPVALAAVAVLAFVLSRGFRSRRPGPLAATAALFALGAHDLVDFALELPAVALVAALVAGAVVTRRSSRDREEPKLVRGAAVLLLVGVFGAVALSPGLSWMRSDFLARAAESWGEEVPETLEAAVRDHPLDAGLVLLMAWQAHRAQRSDAGRWLNRAMDLAPDWAGPHHLAAQALWNRGRLDQAALELREAESRQPGVGRATVCQWLAAGRIAPVLRAAPQEGGLEEAFLERAASCTGVSPSAVEMIDARLAEVAPELAAPQIRRARREEEPSARLGILLEALERATTASDRGDLAREIARVRIQSDDLAGAARALDEAPEEYRHSSEAWARDRLYLALLQDDETAALPLRAALRGRALSVPPRLAAVHLLEARAFSARGDEHLALAALETAQRVHPAASTLMRIGRTAEQLDMFTRARTAFREACRLEGADSAACAALEGVDERPRGHRQPTP
jgi:tetratricopeptide (TPR) repeat protein